MIRARGRVRAIVPPFLQPGDWVRVAAPSSVLDRRRLAAGAAWLRGRGFRLRLPENAGSRHGYFAGKDGQRARGLNAAIHDREARGILFARGGYGMTRILPSLDLAALRRRPRLLMGFSDITALFVALQRSGPYLCLYGPVVSELADPGVVDAPNMDAALRGEPGAFTIPFHRGDVMKPGRGAGQVIGGCLSILVSLLGTPWDCSYDGCILFWEDIGEEPYRIDRMLTQLRNAGKLDRLAGMLIGSLTGCDAPAGKPSLSVRQAVAEVTAAGRYPVIWNIKAGHLRERIVLPLGAAAQLDTKRGDAVVRLPGKALTRGWRIRDQRDRLRLRPATRKARPRTKFPAPR